MWFPASLGKLGANGCRAVGWFVVQSRGRLLILSMGSLLQGFPSTSPGCILGTNLGTRLLVPVEQCQTWIVPKWCTKKIRQWSLPGAAVVSVLNVGRRVFWLELRMTKLFWTGILCYRKAFLVMFSRRSVQQHGRARQVKGLQSPLCCRAVKMQMTGLTSCCLKRTSGPPLQLGGLSQRRFPNRPFARSGAGCRPSISGWRSSCARTCWLTGCTQRPRLGSHREQLNALPIR